MKMEGEKMEMEYMSREELSKEDYFNILYDLYDFLENDNYEEIKNILRMCMSGKIDKKYVDYLKTQRAAAMEAE